MTADNRVARSAASDSSWSAVPHCFGNAKVIYCYSVRRAMLNWPKYENWVCFVIYCRQAVMEEKVLSGKAVPAYGKIMRNLVR